MSQRNQYLCLLIVLIIGSCKRDPYLNLGKKAYKDLAFTNYFRRTSGWVAGDGAYSIPLSTGKSIWLFGDSYINSYDAATQSVPCLFQARNALLLMDINNPVNQTTLPGNSGEASYFVPGNANNWIWPGAGYQNGDTIFAFVTKLSQSAPDTHCIAKIMLNDFSLNSYYTLPFSNGISFENSFIKDSSGYYYVYGTKNNGFGNDLFVAKFPVNNIYAPWQYYGSNGWSNDINAIARIWDEFTASFYVCKIKQKYVLITTEFSVGCDQGKNIYVAVSDNPTGPFTDQHSIWAVDDTLQGHLPFFYIANPHPQYDNGQEELLISYCINGYANCVNTCVNGRMDPDVYRPKAIRVPFKAIDPSL
ncbi:MAG: hypothetical protein JWO06_1940 [Bacteroidota bacterium]|nr:hypothetical protein [Bacteroidota bacterium]